MDNCWMVDGYPKMQVWVCGGRVWSKGQIYEVNCGKNLTKAKRDIEKSQ